MQQGQCAVLYLRLSKEDADKLRKGDESASIKNQRQMLTDYAQREGYCIVKEYTDENESGLYDTRPGFEEMIKDAGLRKFSVVIAKSQSRFSRNMEHIEQYLHHQFPVLGIRFIGVTDGTDSQDEKNKKSRQITGLVNEWYCEDLSKSIRQVFKTKMEHGQYLGSSCPYGYRKDPLNHNHLIVDDYAAQIVRKIFCLYTSGYGKGKIATILSEEGLLIPTVYKQKVMGIHYHNPNLPANGKLWSFQTVHQILNNPVYRGHMVQNKANKVSYKDKRKINLPQNQWITVKDTHEAIIDEQTWELTKEIQKSKTRSIHTDSRGVFSGKVYCADCKKSMARIYEKGRKAEPSGFICSTYKKRGKAFCENHKLMNEELEEAVLCSIKEEARKLLSPKDVENLGKFLGENEKIREDKKQYDFIKRRLERLKAYKRAALESYTEDILGFREYEDCLAAYREEEAVLFKQEKELEKKNQEIEQTDKEWRQWVKRFIHYIDIEKLDREVVWQLIDKIYVGKEGDILICYHFGTTHV